MAFGSGTVSAAGGAVNDLFQSKATAGGLRLKAQGDLVEGENYDRAAELSRMNEEFSIASTKLKEAMTERQLYQTIGGQRADIAGAGLAASGSALDLLRDSASQGALQSAVLAEQGRIEQMSYAEQGEAYKALAGYARYSADVQQNMAHDAIVAGEVSAGFKAASAVTSLFT